ncbi:hypothetical protein [Calothrix sp. NIES-3974]|uniref:hypothetical protein n=1 Tax=Calothrix sp. NIES-3974 TaxID=2005462 RepID=UPI000B604F10|nr:hypothetical protein [Calothrix sp. NIES-3974]BAZ07517.1 hypothetical protein NIES3974_41810 [Calothrix sp. NIES-3974]
MTTLIDKLEQLKEKVPREDWPIIDWGVMVIQHKLDHNQEFIQQIYQEIKLRLKSINWISGKPVECLLDELEFMYEQSFALHQVGEDGLLLVKTYIPEIKDSFYQSYQDCNTLINQLVQYYQDRCEEDNQKSQNSPTPKEYISYQVSSQICKAISESLTR